MKKRSLILALLFFVVGFTYAQRTVTGTVTDDKNEALVGASVLVKGTTTGAITDLDGKYSINVPKGGTTLVFSFTGYDAKEIALGTSNVVDAKLSSGVLLNETVVTALGIRRDEKSLSYAAQSVQADQLSTIRQTSVNDALAGKIAGIQVRSQSSAALGREAAIRIRGAGSLTDKAPLYVVDGTPINASVDITNGLIQGSVSTRTQQLNSSDLNMDDIQDVTVLKGPTATALYGQRGDAGVILITTKKGQKGQGLGISFSQATSWENVYRLPRYQNAYSGGDTYDAATETSSPLTFKWTAGMPNEWKALDGKTYHDYSDDSSWGPKIDGQQTIPWYAWYPNTPYSYKTTALTAQPNNVRDYYQTGVNNNTNLALSKAGDNYTTRVSFTNQRVTGIQPNTNTDKYILSTQNTFNLSEHFIAGANLNFTTERLYGLIADDYSNQTSGTFGSWFHRDIDMNIVRELRDVRSPEGILGSWNHNNPDSYDPAKPVDFYGANYWYNFYSFGDNTKHINNRNRLYGDVNLTYKLNDHFRVTGFVRKNQLDNKYENRGYSILQSSATQTGLKAYYETGLTSFTEDNFEAIATYNQNFGSVSLDFNAGGNIRRESLVENRSNTSSGLVLPDLFTLSNSVSTIASYNQRRNKEIQSVYAHGSLGYKGWAFLEFSGRNDWSSSLPTNNNSYFYPSLGGSFVFSELLQKQFKQLSYGKLRFGWAKVGSDTDPYAINKNYQLNGATQKWGANVTMFTPDQLPDPNIQPSLSTSIEGGVDLRFFGNRLGLALTVYNEDKINEILRVPVTGTSGYTSKLINAAQVNRNGVEIQLNATPFAGTNFRWDISLNYAKNTTKIIALASGVTEYIQETGTFGTSSGVRLVHLAGSTWGQLRGGGFKRDSLGNKIVDANGIFIAAPNTYLGSVLPDFTGGLQNTFTYKDFTLSVNIDFQKGGKFFSLSQSWGTFSGLTEATAAVNDKGKNVRDPVADGGGVRVQAVTADGKAFDKYVNAYDYYHQFRNRRIAEEFVSDLDYIKLREISLGYRLPVKALGMDKVVRSATIAFIARNPWLIYAASKDFDPSEISNTYGENGQLPGTRSFGFNLKLGF